jgi:hypothetical protein
MTTTATGRRRKFRRPVVGRGTAEYPSGNSGDPTSELRILRLRRLVGAVAQHDMRKFMRHDRGQFGLVVGRGYRGILLAELNVLLGRAGIHARL